MINLRIMSKIYIRLYRMRPCLFKLKAEDLVPMFFLLGVTSRYKMNFPTKTKGVNKKTALLSIAPLNSSAFEKS